MGRTMGSERGFRFGEHTADVLIEGWGRTLEELFEEMAKAMFEVMTDTKRVEPRIKIHVEVCGFDLENLLYRWLEELLYHHDSKNLVFSKFEVKKIFEKSVDGEKEVCLEADAWGEEFDRSRHEPRTVVKAVTYAQMRIWREGDVWRATTVLDI